MHNGDNAEIKKYFVSFWNGVDLRYKLLKGPKVRISIAGIIISRVIELDSLLVLTAIYRLVGALHVTLISLLDDFGWFFPPPSPMI